MFQDSKAFSGFAVKDLEKAKAFYGGTLGQDVRDGPMGILELHLAGGAPVMVYPKDDHVPATYTVLNFPVDDIDKAVDKLIAAGVTMEQYDRADMPQDAKGIARDPDGPSIAWFTDPSGNILSVLTTDAT
ncbi:MAG: VOC family protein [Chloroflexi bacterium]|nr:VOC family protein [Chloroflexota bacterium]